MAHVSRRTFVKSISGMAGAPNTISTTASLTINRSGESRSSEHAVLPCVASQDEINHRGQIR